MRKSGKAGKAAAQAEALLQRAVGLHQAGRLEAAESLYRDLLRAQPGLAAAHHNLGALALQRGDAKQALGHLAEALRALPGRPEYRRSGAYALQMLLDGGRFAEAESAARAFLAVDAGFAAAWKTLAQALRAQGREALAAWEQAARLLPEDADVQLALGFALRQANRLDEALASVERALRLQPDSALAHYHRGNVLFQMGRVEAAVTSYAEARRLRPEDLDYRLAQALALPMIVAGGRELAHWRDRFAEQLALLGELPPGEFAPPENIPPFFYLAYHNEDDRLLLERVSAMMRRLVPALNCTAPDSGPGRARRGRIRVGFVSECFVAGHTVAKLFEGILRELDRDRFEVLAIHAVRGLPGANRRPLSEAAERALTLPQSLAGMQAAVAAEAPDVLFYADVGMSPATWLLAHARLAPVQAVGWGHPMTTGIDTLDYFVSADAIEPEGAEACYSERLVRLRRLPCHYVPLLAPTRIPDRRSMGLPEGATLYGCPQSLFKFHPDFDAVLAAIAAGDPDGRIVLLEGAQPEPSARLRARWAKSAPILNERVLFLPRLPLDGFMALMAHIDVLLDPPHFGSGNTLYEAMVYGTPIVTWPGRFARGRIVAAAYRQMGVADAPVAATLDGYAPLALALGRDAARRAALRAELRERAPALFGDLGAVRELEKFFEAAVAAARRGDKLPSGWMPPDENTKATT
jgi:predicted O-linked N-acetylglucosamine transferase (SPINDLY family)